MNAEKIPKRPGHRRGILLAVLIVIALGLSFACATGSGFSSNAETENPLAVTPVKVTGMNSRLVPPGQYVFDNSQEWSRFWSKYHGTDAPIVDLEQSTLLAVFLGQKPHPGYSVGIAGATEHRNEVVVDVVEYLPAPGMFYAQMIMYPYDLALIPKADKGIRFEVSRRAGRP